MSEAVRHRCVCGEGGGKDDEELRLHEPALRKFVVKKLMRSSSCQLCSSFVPWSLVDENWRLWKRWIVPLILEFRIATGNRQLRMTWL